MAIYNHVNVQILYKILLCYHYLSWLFCFTNISTLWNSSYSRIGKENHNGQVIKDLEQSSVKKNKYRCQFLPKHKCYKFLIKQQLLSIISYMQYNQLLNIYFNFLHFEVLGCACVSTCSYSLYLFTGFPAIRNKIFYIWWWFYPQSKATISITCKK